SAIRTPISAVRSVTHAPTTENNPIAARAMAIAANAARSDAAKRHVATDRAVIAVIGSTSPTGNAASIAATSSRIIRVIGWTLSVVRMTRRNVATGSSAIGTY